MPLNQILMWYGRSKITRGWLLGKEKERERERERERKREQIKADIESMGVGS